MPVPLSIRCVAGCPKSVATGPNDIWAADYKGQFRLKNGQYCFPLTVSDLFSRYLLGCEAHPEVSLQRTMKSMSRTVRFLNSELRRPEAYASVKRVLYFKLLQLSSIATTFS